jgi:predicted secreted protein
VNLEELGSAGYTWEVKNLDADYFEILDVRTDDTHPQGDITGAPVLKTWLFRLKKAGKSELRFIYHRSWEGDKSASENFVLKVRIVP